MVCAWTILVRDLCDVCDSHLTSLSIGECDFNPEFMLKSCVRACGACDLDATAIQKLIERKTRITKAGGNEKFLETPYGMSQFIFDYMEDHVTGLFRNMTTYMEDIVMKDPRYESVRDRCKNKHRECAQWKLSGQCEQVSRLCFC